jgi:hypothetical protein
MIATAVELSNANADATVTVEGVRIGWQMDVKGYESSLTIIIVGMVFSDLGPLLCVKVCICICEFALNLCVSASVLRVYVYMCACCVYVVLVGIIYGSVCCV